MALAASVLLVVLLGSHATIRIDNAIYDLATKFDRRAPRQDIVIVAFDSRSLAYVKKWPWPRRAEADVINAIVRDDPAALACYFLFMFPTTTADDQSIHDAMLRTKTFIPVPREGGTGLDARNVLAPIPAVVSAVSGTGLGDQVPDADGIARRAQLSVGKGVDLKTRLVLQMARLRASKDSGLAPNARADGRAVLVPYVGPAGSFTTISALSLLRNEVPAGFFHNKFVLMGATARDLLDDYPTPTSPLMPNVEIDANLLNGLLAHSLIYAAGPLETILISLAILWVLMLALLRLGPRDNLLFAVGMMALPLVGSVLLLFGANFWIPPCACLLTLVIVTLYWGWRRLHAASDYLAAELRGLQRTIDVESISEPRPAARQGDVVLRQMTLLQEAKKRISDLRRFVSDILANFPEPIFVVDLEGKILTVNEAATSLANRLGASAGAEAPVDAILSKITPFNPGAGQGWPPIAELALRSGSANIDQSLTGKAPDGRAFELRFTPTLSASDEPTGWIVHLADITVLMLALDQREVAKRQREEAFAAAVARHALAAGVDPCGAQAPGLPGTRPPGSFSLSTTRRVGPSTSPTPFVRLAQAESADLMLEALDFCFIAEEAIDALWSLAQQGCVTLQLESRGEFVVLGDRSALMRALINLLDNAVKFSKPGTTVSCVVRPCRDRWPRRRSLRDRRFCRGHAPGPGRPAVQPLRHARSRGERVRRASGLAWRSCRPWRPGTTAPSMSHVAGRGVGFLPLTLPLYREGDEGRDIDSVRATA